MFTKAYKLLKTANDLVESFVWLCNNELMIKNKLIKRIPDYSMQIYKAKDIIRNL